MLFLPHPDRVHQEETRYLTLCSLSLYSKDRSAIGTSFSSLQSVNANFSGVLPPVKAPFFEASPPRSQLTSIQSTISFFQRLTVEKMDAWPPRLRSCTSENVLSQVIIFFSHHKYLTGGPYFGSSGRNAPSSSSERSFSSTSQLPHNLSVEEN